MKDENKKNSRSNLAAEISKGDREKIAKMLLGNLDGKEALFNAFENFLFELADIRALQLDTTDKKNPGFAASTRYWAVDCVSGLFSEIADFTSRFEDQIKKKSEDNNLPTTDEEYK